MPQGCQYRFPGVFGGVGAQGLRILKRVAKAGQVNPREVAQEKKLLLRPDIKKQGLYRIGQHQLGTPKCLGVPLGGIKPRCKGLRPGVL